MHAENVVMTMARKLGCMVFELGTELWGVPVQSGWLGRSQTGNWVWMAIHIALGVWLGQAVSMR